MLDISLRTSIMLLNGSFFLLQSAMDIPGLNLSQQEYYPYVYYKIECNLLDLKV